MTEAASPKSYSFCRVSVKLHAPPRNTEFCANRMGPRRPGLGSRPDALSPAGAKRCTVATEVLGLLQFVCMLFQQNLLSGDTLHESVTKATDAFRQSGVLPLERSGSRGPGPQKAPQLPLDTTSPRLGSKRDALNCACAKLCSGESRTQA